MEENNYKYTETEVFTVFFSLQRRPRISGRSFTQSIFALYGHCLVD